MATETKQLLSDDTVFPHIERAIDRFLTLDAHGQTVLSEMFRAWCYHEEPLKFPQFVASVSHADIRQVVTVILLPTRAHLSEEEERGIASATMMFAMGLAIAEVQREGAPVTNAAIFKNLQSAAEAELIKIGPFDSLAPDWNEAVSILQSLQQNSPAV